MVLRHIMRFFFYTYNNEITDKLANSYLFRRAARFTAYILTKGELFSKNAIQKLESSETLDRVENKIRQTHDRLQRFSGKFSSEFKDATKQAEEKLKEKR